MADLKSRAAVFLLLDSWSDQVVVDELLQERVAVLHQTVGLGSLMQQAPQLFLRDQVTFSVRTASRDSIGCLQLRRHAVRVAAWKREGGRTSEYWQIYDIATCWSVHTGLVVAATVIVAMSLVRRGREGRLPAHLMR